MLLRGDELAANREVKMEFRKVIQAGSEVVGSDGILAGIVDRVERDSILLVEQVGNANRLSLCRYIPIMFMARIETGRVFLSTTADEAVMFEDTPMRHPRNNEPTVRRLLLRH